MDHKGQESWQPSHFLVETIDLSSCIFLVESLWEEDRLRMSIINQRMLPLEEGEPLLMDSVCISGFAENAEHSKKKHTNLFLRTADLGTHHLPAISADDPMLFLLLPSAVSQLRRVFHVRSKKNAVWEMADIYRAALSAGCGLYEALYFEEKRARKITRFREIGSESLKLV